MIWIGIVYLAAVAFILRLIEIAPELEGD